MLCVNCCNMKEKLNRNRLIYMGAEPYQSSNPKVDKAQIVKYHYGIKWLYQPQLKDVDGATKIDNCAYWDKEKAQKAIDAYGILPKPRHSVEIP